MHEDAHHHCLAAAESLGGDLVRAIRDCGPVGLPLQADLPFPDYLCRAIAGQQLSVAAARTIWGRVTESAGRKRLITHLAEAGPGDLRACGLSKAKAKSMAAIASAARAGALNPDLLAAMDHAERSARLTAIWGVGQWTVDMVSMFYFGDPDIWPDGDIAARKTLTALTSPRRKTARTAARFAPYRSYLALYMWHHRDAKPF